MNKKYGAISGGKAERLYVIWRGIKRRCLSPKEPAYKDYGARGISLCKDWMDYLEFKRWALSGGYSENLTIDRIDNNRGYCPENCKWSSRKDQARNRRTSSFLEIDGKKKTIAEWSDEYGVSHSLIMGRINRLKWDVEKAIKTPAHRAN